MGIRFKLLILLFFIALVPLLVVSFRIQNDLRELGEGLVTRSSNNLVRKANSGLQRIVEDHARLLQREKQLLEANTQFLASRIEGILYGHEHSITDSRSMPPAAQVLEAKNEYYLLHMNGFQNLVVDFNFFDTNKRYDPETEKTSPAFNGKLLQILRQVKFKYPELVLWIEIKLSGEFEISYPKSSVPMHMRHLFSNEINSRYANELTWSLPKLDKRTRRLVFNVSTPLKDENGAIQGEITIVVPVSALLHKNQYASMLSGNATSFIVSHEADKKTMQNRLKVIAKEQDHEKIHDHWIVPEKNTWINPDNAEQFNTIIDSLESSTSGVTEIPYEGKDTLWAYAPIDRGGVSLMILVPKTDIVKEAQSAKDFILAQIDFHNRKMGYTAIGVAIMVLALAFLLSKLITRNIFELATAVGEIAKGNFTARVEVRGKDEISQLGLAFNQMRPKLKERVNLKNALEVAQQIQQNLLPTHNPKFHGADIAAFSEYYYETGGDYYGFIPRQTAEGESLVVAVGDVSGHGIPAALMMCSARAYIRCQATAGGRLDDVVKRTNELVAQDVDQTGRFMTLFLLELTESKTIRWVRAGHDPAFVYDPSEDRFEELAGEGLPLGVMHNTRFELGERSDLSSGRIIVIGTDGIWEMLSPEGEMFGKERLKDVIRTHKDKSSAAIIHAVVDTLNEFRRTAGQIDDLTIAVIKTS